jgi:TetR/AcrR family transcriptional regulator, transcriptional repressor for nem operon
MSVSSKKLRKPKAAPDRTHGDAANTILDVAEHLAQRRGYNGFSYADIAQELGVTKASLHYHFASKEELGRALIERYHASFSSALESIGQSTADPGKRLRQYVALYGAVIRDDRMCLCGMLAAEYTTLPASMQDGLKRFFDLNEHWLESVLQEGRQLGSLSFKDTAMERARSILGSLEGAMLVARSFGDARRFQSAAAHLLSDCGVGGRLPRADPA